MSEENVKTDEEISTEKKANENEVAVDKTELERLKAADVRVVELDKYATEAGMENAEEYQSTLEDMAYDKKLAEDKKTVTAKVEEKPAEKPTGDSETINALKEEIRTMKLAVSQSVLGSQYNNFRDGQRALPEEDQSKATEQELTKLINTPSKQPMLLELSKDFGGNIYAAADNYLTVKSGIERARKEGADAATALANAATSADLNTGGKTAAPSNLTAEEKVAERQKEAADNIAADTPYVMPK